MCNSCIFQALRKNILLEKVYDNSPETKPIFISHTELFTFTKVFKYLGSWLHFNLRDDFDVEARIKAASKGMGALRKFWKIPEVDLRSKYLIYMAIPINLLLWGSEKYSQHQLE